LNFQKSSLYQAYKQELDEILKHKWIESEKVGYDIGFEKALMDWITHHKAKYTKARQKDRASDV
jgi:hypothetical protein